MHILGFITLHGIYYVVNFILFSLVNDDMESSKRCVIRFITCSLIMFFETLTLLYLSSRIRPQCCMLHVLKSEVFIRGGGGMG